MTILQAILSLIHPSEEEEVNMPRNGDEPNPPRWPLDKDNAVVIVDEAVSEREIRRIQKRYQDTFDEEKRTFRTDDDHFSHKRTAIMFEKGRYKFDIQCGYYTQVMGLGSTASDVVFEGTDYGPYCPAYNLDIKITAADGGGHEYTVNGISLDSFWRSAENFTNRTNKGLLWAVSQAAPIRRVRAQNSLNLSDGTAYSSGGHMANCVIDGDLSFGTQQQFCCRSVTLNGQVNLGAWSNVFVDCVNSPPPSDGSRGAAVTAHTPAITVEKPYIVKEERFSLCVPKPRIRTADASPLGADLEGNDDEKRSFEKVYVAWAKLGNDGDFDRRVASKINKALTQGKDVVLSPGIYHLEAPIQMKRSNQVLLGIGMATLVAPRDGSPCIEVASKLEGVRVAGIMFEASRLPENRTKVASFIEWGMEGVTGSQDPGNPLNPGVMSDVFCRVGGSSLDRSVSTDVMVRVHSGHVLGDNLWLWRADHVELGQHELPNFPPLDYHQTLEGEVPVKTGLEVNGDNVIIHGLAVEHTTEHQVIWRGENGQVHFYQCELPYDVSSDFGRQNYLGYLVEENVEKHILGGAGVYSNFRDHDVLVKTAIQHPKVFDFDNPQVINSFTKHLNNKGTIMTVVSDGKQKGGGPAIADGPPARFPSLPNN